MQQEGVASLWKGLTPFATHLTLKYALRMGTNAFYQGLLRDQVRRCAAAGTPLRTGTRGLSNHRPCMLDVSLFGPW